MTEQQIDDGWKAGNIARIVDQMLRYNVSLAELAEALTITPVNAKVNPKYDQSTRVGVTGT